MFPKHALPRRIKVNAWWSLGSVSVTFALEVIAMPRILHHLATSNNDPLHLLHIDHTTNPFHPSAHLLRFHALGPLRTAETIPYFPRPPSLPPYCHGMNRPLPTIHESNA